MIEPVKNQQIIDYINENGDGVKFTFLEIREYKGFNGKKIKYIYSEAKYDIR